MVIFVIFGQQLLVSFIICIFIQMSKNNLKQKWKKNSSASAEFKESHILMRQHIITRMKEFVVKMRKSCF